jgi:hypothetical protein
MRALIGLLHVMRAENSTRATGKVGTAGSSTTTSGTVIEIETIGTSTNTTAIMITMETITKQFQGPLPQGEGFFALQF